MLPKWCNAPLQVQRVVIAGGRASYGAADVLVGRVQLSVYPSFV